jgi:chemotaxis protein histidine kinase CheA
MLSNGGVVRTINAEEAVVGIKGKSILGIAAWSLAGLMAVAALVAALVGAGHAGRAASLGEGLKNVASAAGAEPIEADALKDDAARADAVQGIIGAIDALHQQLEAATQSLAAARSEGEAARAEAASARAEAQELAAQAQEAVARADELSKNLAAKSDELAAANTSLAEARTAADAAAEESARMESAVERLTAETARLRAEIEMLRLPESIAMQMEQEMAEPDGAGAEEPEEAEEEPEFLGEPDEDLAEGQIIGISEMFKRARYDEAEQSLRFVLLDGQTLFYQGVPRSVVDQFAQARETLDITYLRRIQGAFRSVPPDNVVVRKYWKWHRRHKAKSEVRFVEKVAEPAGPVAAQ